MTKARSNATAPNAKGTLVVGNGTDASTTLAVASTAGYVLTVDSAEATGLKWATASSGALTKISSTTFSNVASQDIDNVFSSTYNNYLVVLQNMSAATQTDDLQIQLRHSTTTKTTGYYGALDSVIYTGTSTITAGNNVSQMTLSTFTGTVTSAPTVAYFYAQFSPAAGASSRASIYGKSYAPADAIFGDFGWDWSGSENWTGFKIKSSSTNISGTVIVYGLAN